MVSLILSSSVSRNCTAVDRPVASDELDQLSAAEQKLCQLQGFEGKLGQTLVVPSDDRAVTVLVGTGPSDSQTPESLRASAAAYARVVKTHKTVATTLAQSASEIDPADAVRAVAEGIRLPLYRYTAYSSDDSVKLQKVSVVAKGAGLKAELTKTLAVLDAVDITRDLVNEPGGSLTPESFAQKARKMGTAAGLSVTVWTEKRISREKMGGLLAVNQGSEHPPRLVKLEYKPAKKPTGKIALVGKGITFDSGGLSIKTSAGMMTMKVDMAGGAAVLGTMLALAAVKSPVSVTGYIPLTDNMTGGDAQRPGDVFTARNGTTVEVLNTDAEGRLVLADALSLASDAKPDAIIDIATLTGSATAALGTSYAAVMANDDELSDRLIAASERTGEKVWRLPLPEEYRSQLDSTVADIKNIASSRFAGALLAGLFLEEFVDGYPWGHIDLGMSAFSETDSGTTVKGGTGFGVRLLLDAFEHWDDE